MYLLKVTK